MFRHFLRGSGRHRFDHGQRASIDCALVREEVAQFRQGDKELPAPGTRPMKEAVLA